MGGPGGRLEGRRRRLFQQQLRYSLAHLLHHITSSNDSSQIESELGQRWLVQKLKFTLRLSHQYSIGVSFLWLLKLVVWWSLMCVVKQNRLGKHYASRRLNVEELRCIFGLSTSTNLSGSERLASQRPFRLRRTNSHTNVLLAFSGCKAKGSAFLFHLAPSQKLTTSELCWPSGQMLSTNLETCSSY